MFALTCYRTRKSQHKAVRELRRGKKDAKPLDVWGHDLSAPQKKRAPKRELATLRVEAEEFANAVKKDMNNVAPGPPTVSTRSASPSSAIDKPALARRRSGTLKITDLAYADAAAAAAAYQANLKRAQEQQAPVERPTMLVKRELPPQLADELAVAGKAERERQRERMDKRLRRKGTKRKVKATKKKKKKNKRGGGLSLAGIMESTVSAKSSSPSSGARSRASGPTTNTDKGMRRRKQSYKRLLDMMEVQKLRNIQKEIEDDIKKEQRTAATDELRKFSNNVDTGAAASPDAAKRRRSVSRRRSVAADAHVSAAAAATARAAKAAKDGGARATRPVMRKSSSLGRRESLKLVDSSIDDLKKAAAASAVAKEELAKKVEKELRDRQRERTEERILRRKRSSRRKSKRREKTDDEKEEARRRRREIRRRRSKKKLKKAAKRASLLSRLGGGGHKEGDEGSLQAVGEEEEVAETSSKVTLVPEAADDGAKRTKKLTTRLESFYEQHQPDRVQSSGMIVSKLLAHTNSNFEVAEKQLNAALDRQFDGHHLDK